jgi:hypothetical protein
MTLGTPIRQAGSRRGGAAKVARRSRAESPKGKKDAQAIRRWLDDLSAGLADLPPIPADFRRSDAYDDHD